MRLRSFVVVGCLLGLAGPTWARGPAEDVDREIAQRHYKQGISSYEGGDYEGALKEFIAARQVMNAPALDFNIARCYDRLERLPEAIVQYQRYVDSVPTPGDADEVRERIKVLQARVLLSSTTPPPPVAPSKAPRAEPAAPPAVAPPSPPAAAVVQTPPPPRRPLARRPWFWVVVVGGAAVAATGIALGITFGSSTTHPSGTLGTVAGN